MKKFMLKTSILSIATAILLATAGCSSGGGDSAATAVTTASGGAIDGYLQGATVFVDSTADGEHNATEQSVVTDTNGDFTLVGTIANGTKIYASGGIDRSTGYPFEGRLSTTFDNTQEVILSPLTTFVTALVDRNISVEDATNLVAANLGIDPADVNKDPMTVPTVFLAAQKVQKSVEVIVAATGADDFNSAYEDVFASLAIVAEDNVTNPVFDVADLVTEVETNPTITIDPTVTPFLETFVATVDELDDLNVSTADLDTYGELLNTYTEVAEGALDNNDTLDDAQLYIDDLNVTETVVAVEDGNFTDPLIDALAEVESAIDNNITYLGTNSTDDNILTSLVLTDASLAPFDSPDLNLTWSSNNIGVIDTDGTVVRQNVHTAVQIKATVNNALVTNNRTFDLIVKRNEIAPVAVDENITIDEDSAVATVDLSASVSDLNLDIPVITAIGSATNGTATLLNGVVSYVPALNFNGSDSFTYTVTDDTGLTATANVNITTSAVNDAPVAVADTITTSEEVEVTVDVVANDTDVDGDTLIVSAVTNAANGLVAFSDGNITYTPALNFVGTDVVTYTLSDGSIDVNATLTITVVNVNDAPVANNDSVTTEEETSVTVDVLSNDTDVDGNTLSVIAVSSNATFTSNSVTYLPTLDFTGSDTVTYTISDGFGGEANATISITVTNVNDAPVATDSTHTANEDGDTTGNVPVATDVDGNINVNGYLIGTNTSKGSVTLDANGSYTFAPSTAFESLAQDATEDVTFTYTASDTNGTLSNVATVTVTVNGVNDAPVANSNDQTLSIKVLNELNGQLVATDVDTGAILTYTEANVTAGSIVLNSNGSFVFTAPDTNQTVTLNYTVSDGNLTDTGTHSITVTLSDPPVAIADSATVNEDASVSIDVLTNDTDDNNATLTTVSATTPANGTATIEANSTITYLPVANFNGTDSFSYTIEDPDGGQATATVSINVIAQNDAPVITAISDLTILEDSTPSIDTNVTDVDLDNIVYSVDSNNTGIVTVTMINSVIDVTTVENANGIVSITLTANDGTVSVTETFTLTVTPVNDAPTIQDLSISVNGGSSVSGQMISSDIDGDVLTVTSDVVGGFTLTDANGSFTFDASAFDTLALNSQDTVTVALTVSDGTLEDNATLTITVNGTYIAPVVDTNATWFEGKTFHGFWIDNYSETEVMYDDILLDTGNLITAEEWEYNTTSSGWDSVPSENDDMLLIGGVWTGETTETYEINATDNSIMTLNSYEDYKIDSVTDLSGQSLNLTSEDGSISIPVTFSSGALRYNTSWKLLVDMYSLGWMPTDWQDGTAYFTLEDYMHTNGNFYWDEINEIGVQAQRNLDGNVSVYDDGTEVATLLLGETGNLVERDNTGTVTGIVGTWTVINLPGQAVDVLTIEAVLDSSALTTVEYDTYMQHGQQSVTLYDNGTGAGLRAYMVEFETAMSTFEADTEDFMCNDTALADIKAAVEAYDFSVTSADTTPLLGSWVYDENGDPEMRNVLTFLDDSNYIIFHKHTDTGGTQTAGSSEQGTYTWDGSSVTFALVAESDGDGGFTDIHGTQTPMTLSVDGNTLTFDFGVSVDYLKVADVSDSMVGSWVSINGVDIYTLTILSSNDYCIVHAATDGVGAIPEYLYGEFGTFSDDGTYTTFIQTVDTDGSEGLSSIGTSIVLTEDPGVSLSFNTSTENFTFSRLPVVVSSTWSPDLGSITEADFTALAHVVDPIIGTWWYVEDALNMESITITAGTATTSTGTVDFNETMDGAQGDFGTIFYTVHNDATYGNVVGLQESDGNTTYVEYIKFFESLDQTALDTAYPSITWSADAIAVKNAGISNGESFDPWLDAGTFATVNYTDFATLITGMISGNTSTDDDAFIIGNGDDAIVFSVGTASSDTTGDVVLASDGTTVAGSFEIRDVDGVSTLVVTITDSSFDDHIAFQLDGTTMYRGNIYDRWSDILLNDTAKSDVLNSL